MVTRINVRLSPKLEKQSNAYVAEFGSNTQELIKEALREKVHADKLTYSKKRAEMAKTEKTYSREDLGF